MYIGNIITKQNLDIENFKICPTLEGIDETLPTLIIGWKKVKTIYGNTVSILHKKISSRIFWTFNKKERKVEYDEDIENFKEYCFTNFGENIPYVYLDILYGKKRINYRIIKKILSLESPITYLDKNGMIYIFCENIIFGVDLNILEFFEGKKEKVISKIHKLKNNVFVDNEIFNNRRDFVIKIKDKKRLIPYVVNIELNG
jgi:hypothetical protein